MRVLKKIIFVFIGVMSLAGASAEKNEVKPVVTLEASATNIVVTEETRLTFKVWIPPLEGDLSELPPFLSKKPPHVVAGFLEPDWKAKELSLDERIPLPPVPHPKRNFRGVFYTLNNFVSNDIFAEMRDPFSLMDDDFFSSAFGPKQQRFPLESKRVERDGVNGWEFSFMTQPYRAVAAGRVTIPAVSVRFPVITGIEKKRDRFGRVIPQVQIKEIACETSDVTIDVVSPDETKMPPSYCGAISSNLTVKASLDSNVCTAGDPLILTIDISGANDLSSLHIPDFAMAVNKSGIFRIDASSLKTETLAASRRFTWRVRTIKAGTVEFPSIAISYFNLARREYETLKTDIIPIQVKAGAQATLGSLDETGDEVDELPLPDGIDVDARGASSVPLLMHLVLSLLLFIAAPVIFLLVRMIPSVRTGIRNRNEAVRRQKAFSKCKRALKSKNLSKRRSAICRFFEERYSLNGASVTANDAQRIMRDDYSAEEISLVANALNECDMNTYSSTKKVVVGLIMISFAMFTASAASTEFTFKRACSLAGRAQEVAQFKAAANAFADCIRDGAANDLIFYDFGATSLMGGDARAALAAFRRAELYSGETASTRRGVRSALAHIQNDARADLPLTRIIVKPHFMYSLDVRLLFACACWALCWIVALLPACGLRRFLFSLILILTIAASVSVAMSFVELHATEEVLYVTK